MARLGLIVVLMPMSASIGLAINILESKDSPCDQEACFGVELLQRNLSLQRGIRETKMDTDFREAISSYEHPSWLSSCEAIYLDIGSNIGVQVRKLYEAEKYPDAYILPLFETHFGSPEQRRAPGNTSGICALGMEPNPDHRNRLRALSKAYNANGWHVHFYPFAAWKEESYIEFNISEDPEHVDWGAAISYLQRQTKNQWRLEKVRTVDFSNFVGSLPTGSVKLMKMDIEGAEWETVARMMQERRLCADQIKEAFIEVHNEGSTDLWNDTKCFETLQSRVQNHPGCIDGCTVLSEVDDETYLLDVDDNFGTPPFEPNTTELQRLRESEPGTLPLAQMSEMQVLWTHANCEARRVLLHGQCTINLPYRCNIVG